MLSPFLFLDIESKVIKEECLAGKVSFHLKAKGDEMRISCSVIKESGSTGTDPLLRIHMVLGCILCE